MEFKSDFRSGTGQDHGIRIRRNSVLAIVVRRDIARKVEVANVNKETFDIIFDARDLGCHHPAYILEMRPERNGGPDRYDVSLLFGTTLPLWVQNRCGYWWEDNVEGKLPLAALSWAVEAWGDKARVPGKKALLRAHRYVALSVAEGNRLISFFGPTREAMRDFLQAQDRGFRAALGSEKLEELSSSPVEAIGRVRCHLESLDFDREGVTPWRGLLFEHMNSLHGVCELLLEHSDLARGEEYVMHRSLVEAHVLWGRDELLKRCGCCPAMAPLFGELCADRAPL